MVQHLDLLAGDALVRRAFLVGEDLELGEEMHRRAREERGEIPGQRLGIIELRRHHQRLYRMVALQESGDEGRTAPVQGGEPPPLGLTNPAEQTVLRGPWKQPVEHRSHRLGGPNIGGPRGGVKGRRPGRRLGVTMWQPQRAAQSSGRTSMGIERYEGDEIAVSYEVKRCIHAAACVRGLPAVFEPQHRPWVRLEDASAEEVARVVERCPTGALRYELAGGRSESPAAVSEVIPAANGPLYLRGEIVIKDALGMELAQELRVALCRCGGSASKPYCDGRHLKLGFSDPGHVPPPPGAVVPDPVAAAAGPGGAAASGTAAAALGTVPTPLPGGPLQITLTKNGPLRLQGAVLLRSVATGVTCPAQRLSLCRCGGSQNKPYCDGTHGRIGFEV